LAPPTTATAEVKNISDRHARVSVGGSWSIERERPRYTEFEVELRRIAPRRVTFSADGLGTWDSSLLAFVAGLQRFCAASGIEADTQGLPEGMRVLLNLAAQPPDNPPQPSKGGGSFLDLFGRPFMNLMSGARDALAFIGETTIASARLVSGRSRFHFSDAAAIMQQCGPEALPIVTLISVLVGLILAYIGAIQLQKFGATIYVANLVGLGMLREMGAIMAAIVMAGRTGAAFAAQLGTMQVNEEIDALRTLGISPMEYLVLPRLVALVLMMPLLCIYADFLGILGGGLVGVTALNINFQLFLEQTRAAIGINDLFVGVVKAFTFGVLIAVAGCLRGLQSSRSASAVGDAVTSAVVTSIVSIVVADAIFAVITNMLGV